MFSTLVTTKLNYESSLTYAIAASCPLGTHLTLTMTTMTSLPWSLDRASAIVQHAFRRAGALWHLCMRLLLRVCMDLTLRALGCQMDRKWLGICLEYYPLERELKKAQATERALHPCCESLLLLPES